MQATYANRNFDPNVPCKRFGRIVTDVQIIHKDCKSPYKYMGVLEYLGLTFFNEDELYFPNHPQGYNQPCFK